MDFIKRHLIKTIKEKINERQDCVNFKSYFFLDEVIKEKDNVKRGNYNGKIIDRVNSNYAYLKGFEYPIHFDGLNGQSLIKLYESFKENKFYFYKKKKTEKGFYRLKTRIK